MVLRLKMLPTRNRELRAVNRRSGDLNRQNLAAAIVPTRRAGSVSADSATTLRTLRELRGVPAVGGFSRPKSHLGRFSFWYTHFS
jgi:hypothetical protein